MDRTVTIPKNQCFETGCLAIEYDSYKVEILSFNMPFVENRSSQWTQNIARRLKMVTLETKENYSSESSPNLRKAMSK